MYSIKVLTPEFKAKVDEFINKEVLEITATKKLAPERTSFFKSFQSLIQRGYLNTLWNNGYKDYPEVLEYYQAEGMMTPEYTEQILEPAEKGFQSRARVLWNGEIQKIDDIDEIISYKWINVNKHVFYKTEDKDAPQVVKDRNDEVVLSMCRHCKQAEADLQEYCPATSKEE